MVGIDMSDVIDLCDVDLSTCGASLGMMQSFIDSPVGYELRIRKRLILAMDWLEPDMIGLA